MTFTTDTKPETTMQLANELALTFLLMMGGMAREGHRFDQSTNPKERLCWLMACQAYDDIAGVVL